MPNLPPHPARPHRSLRANLMLALMPTASVLLVFALVDAFSHQRLLFASLASSAFLVYLDPDHEVSSVRTLILAQGLAALVGFAAHTLFGGSDWGAAGAMVIVVFGMILIRAMHPPAVSTALSFALVAGTGRGLVLFGVCVGVLALLIFLQRGVLRLLSTKRGDDAESSG